MAKEKKNIQNSLMKLEETVAWFDSQQDVDVEEGLRKVKEGAALIKDLRGKLKKVENEFEDIKKDLEVEG